MPEIKLRTVNFGEISREIFAPSSCGRFRRGDYAIHRYTGKRHRILDYSENIVETDLGTVSLTDLLPYSKGTS